LHGSDDGFFCFVAGRWVRRRHHYAGKRSAAVLADGSGPTG